jgi:hypothetical protein
MTQPTVTAVDLYNFTQCAHRVYLDANGDPAQKGEVSKFVQLLWEKGLQTRADPPPRTAWPSEASQADGRL